MERNNLANLLFSIGSLGMLVGVTGLVRNSISYDSLASRGAVENRRVSSEYTSYNSASLIIGSAAAYIAAIDLRRRKES